MVKFTVRKIAIVSSFFPPSEDPVAGYSYYLSKELTGLGVKVKVITSWKNEACGSKTVGGFPVACIPAKKLLGRFFHIKRRHFKDVLAEIEEFNPDCVVVNDYVRRLSFFGAKAARSLGVPCIAVNHLFSPLSHKNGIADSIMKAHEKRMLRLFKKYRAVFAGASAPQTAHLKNMGAVPRYEIPYGIETDILPLPAAKKKLGIGADTILYAVMGSDSEDTEKLIKALDDIRHFSGPEIALVVIGKKPKGMVCDEKHVIFTGDVTLEDKTALKYGCDVYVHFVKKDSLGLELMEAGLLARAVVCVLPEAGYHFRAVNNLVSGLVTDDGEHSVKAALQKLRLHSKLRSELGEKLKQETELRYSWAQSALALVDAVWELNGGRRH